MPINLFRACALGFTLLSLSACGDSPQTNTSSGTFEPKKGDEIVTNPDGNKPDGNKTDGDITVIVDPEKPPQPPSEYILFAAPSGSGNICSQQEPCGLLQAQTKTRGLRSDFPDATVKVNLLDGVYELQETLRFGPEDSGTSGKPVVWQAAEGSKPVISGGTKISGWTLHDEAKNIWVASVPTGSKSRQLYVDGKSAPIAQATPGELGFVLEKTLTGWKLNDEKGNTNGYSISGDSVAKAWFEQFTPEEIKQIEFRYIQGNGNWTDSRCRVERHWDIFLYMQQPCWDSTTKRNQPATYVRTGDLPAMGDNKMPSIIENAYVLLSRGEWFLNEKENKIFYIPKMGEYMDSLDVRLPKLERLVTVAGSLNQPVHDIEFRGLQFSHATWNGPSLNTGFSEVRSNLHITAVNQGLCQFYTPTANEPLTTCPYGAYTQPLSNVTVSAAYRVSFVENRFTNLGGIGLTVSYGSLDTKIVGNIFNEISSAAIFLGCTYDPNPDEYGDLIKKNCTPNPDELEDDIIESNEILTRTVVNNNLIHDIGLDYWAAPAIALLFARETTITHNQIFNTPYTGITAGIVQGYVNNANRPNNAKNVNRANNISFNLIHDVMQKLQNGGAITVVGKQAQIIADETGEPDELQTLANGLLVEGNVSHTLVASHVYYNDAGSEWVNWKDNVSFNALSPSTYGIGGCQVTGNLWISGNYLSGKSNVFNCGVTPKNLNYDTANNFEIPNETTYDAIPFDLFETIARAGLTKEYHKILSNVPARASYIPSFTEGKTVMLAGYGFTRETRVSIGGDDVPVQFISPGFVSFTAPATTGKEHLFVNGEVALYAKMGHSATATASTDSKTADGPENAIDSNPETAWSSQGNQKGPFTLTQTFATESIVDEIFIKEWRDNEKYSSNWRTGSFKIEAQIDGKWTNVAAGSSLGPSTTIRLDQSINATALRLITTSHYQKPIRIQSFYALQH